MSKRSSQDAANVALRTATALRIQDTRRILQVAKESLDNVERATNVRLITSIGKAKRTNQDD